MNETIKIGIIDIDEHARKDINRLVSEYNTENKNLTIDILFESEKLSPSKIQRPPLPDLLILDIEQQDFRTVEQIKRIYPNIDVIVATKIQDIATVRKSFRNGAISYLCKQTCMPLLTDAIVTIHQGGSYVSPKISRALINQLRESKKYEDLLTTREMQVANGIVEGMSYKMIAHRYELSLDTVRIYVKRVYRKLNINSKGELIAQLAV
ncbi:DNA-binding response regulator [Sphingobacterium shayense]|uniref:LuxR C-terminal-related transcriptional regulator n=1 Tax=Sphingobacterium shayense TaxID=626343 RepID=UPI0015568A77|nr:LuxR C-terminal-related transcriptional regulator [Sphingobacterium shayense]NQD69792.1 DNA-binding response regulator [Sphingobacterium shayense]